MTLVVMLFAISLIVPSSAFVKVNSTTVDGKMVRFVRELPFGPVTARWHSEITLIDGDGLTCLSAPQVSQCEMIEGNTVTLPVPRPIPASKPGLPITSERPARSSFWG